MQIIKSNEQGNSPEERKTGSFDFNLRFLIAFPSFLQKS